jgi:hypothetical protein
LLKASENFYRYRLEGIYVDRFCGAFTRAVKTFHFDTEWNQQNGIAWSTTKGGNQQCSLNKLCVGKGKPALCELLVCKVIISKYILAANIGRIIVQLVVLSI